MDRGRRSVWVSPRRLRRHPESAARPLRRAHCDGRAIFGIGTGDSAVNNVGRRAAKRDEIEAYCRAFKAMVRGEIARYDDREMCLLWDVPGSDPVPLFLAAEGPKMMQLAGEIGEGVIFGNGISREVVAD